MAGDIGQIQVGRPPSGVRPVAPVAPSPTPVAAPIVVPGGASHGSRTVFLVIGGVALVGIIIAVVYSFSGGTSNSTPTPTASAAPTATLTTQGKNLETYFGAKTASSQDIPPDGTFLAVNANYPSIDLPSDLQTTQGSDIVWLVFGQTELYGSNGQLLTGAATQARNVAIYQLSDVTAAQQALQTWEAGTMSDDLSAFLGYSVSKASTTEFLGGARQSTNIRYRNFPTPDRSIDWAIVTASNGNSYLVIAGSRQSMFAATDALTQ